MLELLLVGLTQFLLWVVLTITLYSVAATILKYIDIKQVQQKEEVLKIGADIDYKSMQKEQKSINNTMKIWNDLKEIDFTTITFSFLFYFLAGYLMYASLYAAVGAAIDSESDTQQFVMPITIPLLFAFAIAQYAIQNPDSSISIWFSLIPFTSPVVMMMRLPFGCSCAMAIIDIYDFVDRRIYFYHRDSRAYIQNRYSHVWKKGKLERTRKMVVL